MSRGEPVPLTASQTVGPYFHIGMHWPGGHVMASAGDTIRVTGVVRDGDGVPVPDALLELWQADTAGRYRAHAGEGFAPLGRAAADGEGRFDFVTVRPGAVTDGATRQAPHLNLVVFARGLLRHLYTRIYFADAADENAADPVLAAVPAARRDTLIATFADGSWHFPVNLQGARETVFFDV